MAIAPGTRIGPYEIVSALGAGGMGEVWRARDERLGRDVAIKVLHESVANDAERRERFEREARAIAALSHPNILAIFDIGAHDGQLYVVTELLEGQTLRERLADGPLPFRKVVDLGVQVAKGLTAAHDRGIIHRDLKPENLFCTTDGLTKILDFGLARQVTTAAGSGASETMAATDPGTVLGTVGYMAPEQVRSKPVDARTDLFALGAVLYEAASGARAFKGDTAADTITAILREDPPEVSTSRADFSPAFDRIVRHCLEKEPADRFQTARDVAFALTSLSGSASSLASGETRLAAAGVERRKARGGAVPIGVALIALAAGAGWAAGWFMAPAASPWTYGSRTRVEQTIFSGRFMPDGETVIISAALSGTSPSLFESRGEGTTPRPFGPPATHLLSVSPSGELLVLANAQFLGQRSFRGTLGRMMVDGTPRAIAEDVREADWLPDGSDFVVVRDRGLTDVLEFPMGTPVYTANGYISTPRVSPDGTRVAFMEHPQKYDNRGWVKVVDRAGAVTTLAGEYHGEEGVVWSPDGADVIYGATLSDDYQVLGVAADGSNAPRPWLTTAGSVFVQDRRADGSLLISRESLYYGAAGRAARGEPERDLTPSDQAWAVSLSLDGKSVLMSDGRGGIDYAVVIKPIEGGPATRLGDGDARNLSPDGAWASALRFSTGKCVVYPTGAGAPVVIDTGTSTCTSALFMGQGSRLALFTTAADGKRSVMAMEFPVGALEPLQLPSGMTGLRGLRPVSPTGWTVGNDANGNWLVASPDGSVTAARGLSPAERFLRWSADGRSLTVASGDSPTVVSRVDWRTGTRTTIETLAPGERAGLINYGLQDFVAETGAYVSSFVRRTSALYVAARQ